MGRRKDEREKTGIKETNISTCTLFSVSNKLGNANTGRERKVYITFMYITDFMMLSFFQLSYKQINLICNRHSVELNF